MMIHRAPWYQQVLPNGKKIGEYGPCSVKTGRPVCHSRAEADYVERYGSLHAVPVAEDGREPVTLDRPERPRYDQHAMAAWVARHGAQRLSSNEMDVYVSFWVLRQSYKQCGQELDKTPAQIYDAVKRIRRKAAL